MIRLIDLGAMYWRNYFAMESAMGAYDRTYEAVLWYWEDSRRMVVCADSPRSWRRELEPTYKAKRKEKPRDAVDSLVGLIETFKRIGIPLALVDGFEADDVIATLVEQAFFEEVQIVGTEKDFYALISDSVSLVGKKGPVGFADCIDKWGVAPEQMTDFLAMVGDVADNIQGCPNCGQHRAALLLQRYGSLEKIREAAASEERDVKGVGEKTWKAIAEWDPTRALELVRLRKDVPISLYELLGDSSEQGT